MAAFDAAGLISCRARVGKLASTIVSVTHYQYGFHDLRSKDLYLRTHREIIQELHKYECLVCRLVAK